MAKLNNKPCQTCSILPLCGSGCSQLALESNGNDYCVHNFDEEKKKNVVKSGLKPGCIKKAVFEYKSSNLAIF